MKKKDIFWFSKASLNCTDSTGHHPCTPISKNEKQIYKLSIQCWSGSDSVQVVFRMLRRDEVFATWLSSNWFPNMQTALCVTVIKSCQFAYLHSTDHFRSFSKRYFLSYIITLVKWLEKNKTGISLNKEPQSHCMIYKVNGMAQNIW